MQSAKLLINLADGPIENLDEGQTQKLESLAEKLAKEPRWNGPEPDALQEMEDTDADDGN